MHSKNISLTFKLQILSYIITSIISVCSIPDCLQCSEDGATCVHCDDEFVKSEDHTSCYMFSSNSRINNLLVVGESCYKKKVDRIFFI